MCYAVCMTEEKFALPNGGTATLVRLSPQPGKFYNYSVSVRIVRVEDGWTTTVVDTPTFYLVSNVQFGCVIGSKEQAENMVRDMYKGLLRDGDRLCVTVVGTAAELTFPEGA